MSRKGGYERFFSFGFWGLLIDSFVVIVLVEVWRVIESFWLGG